MALPLGLLRFKAGLQDSSHCAPGRSCDRPTPSRFWWFPSVPEQNHAALHLSGAASPAITSFPESPKWSYCCPQTQNRTVSSYCCPPNTKPHRFIILLPSKYKTHPPVPISDPQFRTANCHFPSPYRLHFRTLYLVSSLSLPEGRAGSAHNSKFSVCHVETVCVCVRACASQ